MEKAHPQTIISQRLFNMQQNTNNLKRQKNNLYNHLCQLLNQLPVSNDQQNRKIDSLKQLTSISQYIKNCRNRQKQAEPLPEEILFQTVSKRVQYPQWFIKKKQLLSYSAKIKQQSQKRSVLVQNFQKVSKNLFSNVGISFGDQEAYRINVALQKLKQKVNVKQIRFWGKIFTKNSDYYIIQGVGNKMFPEKVQEGMQKYRQGVNYYSYWVNNLQMNNEWHELPLISSQQLRSSRLTKYTFTGNLNTQVRSYPFFKGKQQHFLKAQIVRITHNCQIAPKGLYNPTQQNPDQIQFSEQFKMPDFAELSNLQNWVHINPYILELGRNTYWTDPRLTQQQKQQVLAKLGQSDPRMQRLKGINQDKAVQGKGLQTAWFARVVGSNQVYNNVGKQEGTTSCYGHVSLKNVNWPGWYTFSSMSMFDSIYLGYGIKATQAAFSPIQPENIMIEGQDIEQISEPNPKNPPDELQPDSDDQNKKPEQ